MTDASDPIANAELRSSFFMCSSWLLEVKTRAGGYPEEQGVVSCHDIEAVECASALQREMAKRDDGLPHDRRIDVRIGVHVGDVIVEGEDCHGDAVNVAARLEQLAEPGAICVSQQVVDHVKQKVALGFELRGEEQLKNIVEPVRVYRVRLDATGATERPALDQGQIDEGTGYRTPTRRHLYP